MYKSPSWRSVNSTSVILFRFLREVCIGQEHVCYITRLKHITGLFGNLGFLLFGISLSIAKACQCPCTDIGVVTSDAAYSCDTNLNSTFFLYVEYEFVYIHAVVEPNFNCV